MIEEVQLASDNYSGLIILQKQKSSFLNSVQRNFAEESLELVSLKTIEELHFLKQVDHLWHSIKLPSFSSLEVLPKVNVMSWLVL